jgi:hypothetical protein
VAAGRRGMCWRRPTTLAFVEIGQLESVGGCAVGPERDHEYRQGAPEPGPTLTADAVCVGSKRERTRRRPIRGACPVVVCGVWNSPNQFTVVPRTHTEWRRPSVCALSRESPRRVRELSLGPCAGGWLGCGGGGCGVASHSPNSWRLWVAFLFRCHRSIAGSAPLSIAHRSPHSLLLTVGLFVVFSNIPGEE